jgi:hypothetical protein
VPLEQMLLRIKILPLFSGYDLYEVFNQNDLKYKRYLFVALY